MMNRLNVSIFTRLEERWNGIQVGRQGSYSVERLESFDYYCKTTSFTRVLIVCVLTPVPAVLVTILLDCLPLRPVSEGWSANWVFWVRMTINMLLSCTFGVLEFEKFVPVLHVSFLQGLALVVLPTIMLMPTLISLSSVIGFPIPFIVMLAGLVSGVFNSIVVLLVLGKAPFSKDSPCWPYLQRYQRYSSGCVTVAGLYPLFKAIYDLVPSSYQAFTVVMLSIWKFCARYYVVNATRDLEDVISQTVSFMADLFGSLFISVCMSSASSFYISALFIAADIGQTLLEFHELQTNANILVALLDRRFSTASIRQLKISLKRPNLTAVILAVTRNPGANNITRLHGVRLQACIPHPLPDDRFQQLQTLAASGSYYHKTDSNRAIIRHQSTIVLRFLQQSAVLPAGPSVINVTSMLTPDTVNQTTSECDDVDAKRGEQSEKIVSQGLQLLFHCEYVALVEYIECFVPVIYVLYKSVLELLPNVVYYPGVAGKWNQHIAINILLFALLEIGSFFVMSHMFKRKFELNPLYQVAFVLETQMVCIQQKLFTLMLFVLTYELAHSGVDFSFHFAWLRSKEG
ncbi:uncharacterized protein PHALS_00848 [Plasmopara halstedii]|uniref:Transmembrane protein n=1 Tax=Plasmopara halstedii TaxID=4781 RepID=A0A0P1ATL4_PLAHL|nr:uncharacterized protein PHALS_00848 [Plasmopara halstedii]CEG44486.1 hypothetical protein PHALS_00848 [Plasmopara halstedii]|eukprot:XP_024580855.1 hypothetical protein PHALS_00848 [Plasmopara halstedii]